MAKTGVAELADSVKAKYMSDYLLAAAKKAVWSQFVDWDSIVEGQGGSSFKYVAYEAMDNDDLGAKLPEKDDIEATALTDSEITVTPYEYGRRVTLTSLLRFQSHVKTRQATAKLVGNNMMETVERAIRRGILAGSNVFYANNRVLRTVLGTDTTNDQLTFAYLSQLTAMAHGMGIEPIGNDYVAIIHPALEPALFALSEVKGIGYNAPAPLYTGEIMNLMGIRFIRARTGKMYLGGGKTAQAANDLDGAVSAGDTTITMTDASNIAVADVLTIGALEGATTEQVLVTDIGSQPTLTIKGAGNAVGNFGLKWDHADAEAVTEAANVGAICLLGANSVKGVYGSETGKLGKSVIKENIDSLNRLLSLGWYWYGGVGIVEKYVLRGEVYCPQYVLGGD